MAGGVWPGGEAVTPRCSRKLLCRADYTVSRQRTNLHRSLAGLQRYPVSDGGPLTKCRSDPIVDQAHRPRRGEGRSETMPQALHVPTSIDVSDPRLYQDDTWRPLFERLRHDDPVHYCDASPFGPYWSVTRYDDILAVEL